MSFICKTKSSDLYRSNLETWSKNGFPMGLLSVMQTEQTEASGSVRLENIHTEEYGRDESLTYPWQGHLNLFFINDRLGYL